MPYKRINLSSILLAGILLTSCGGGGSSVEPTVLVSTIQTPAPVTPIPAPVLPPVIIPPVPVIIPPVPVVLPPPVDLITDTSSMTVGFEELWPTSATGVFGVVGTVPLTSTPDGSDPQQGWAYNHITGKWGTLAGLDGTVLGFLDVTGYGPNPYWSSNGKLTFYARPVTMLTGASTGGWALISKQTFSRDKQIIVEAEITITSGTYTAFAGLAMIAGEGDYRELAISRKFDGTDTIDRVAPLAAVRLDNTTPGAPAKLRIEYHPITGFRYFLNNKLIGTEALDHQGASFASDPSVALYFVADSNTMGTYVQGTVGPVHVWVGN
jgi:hypothetical protein